ncbi:MULTISPECIES: hypothetical protein [unclassified Streptomyces]|uniref:hypothetical protein n=1 Tax=unclassified Streptomyces TaxID=2593676 RepID=UPI00336A4802
MTQSGQGNEPQLPAVPPAQPVREGVVLPAQGDQRAHDQHQAAPAGGQAWGQPWGPQGAPQAAPQAPGQPGAPVPPEPLPQPQGGAAAQAQPGWPQNGAQNLPHNAPHNAPQNGFQGGAPQGPPPGAPHSAPPGAPYGGPQGAPLPAQGQPYAQQGWPAQGQQGQQGQPPRPQGQPPMPPQPQGGPPAPDRQAQPFAQDAAETQMLPPQPGFPGPPAADSEATQYIPPVSGQAPGAMPLPPEGPAPAAPPAQAAPGPAPAQPAPASTPLPPENRSGPPESDKESTTVLRAVRPGRARHGAPQAAPQPAPGQPAPGAADQTQVLPGPIPAAGQPPQQQGHHAAQAGGPQRPGSAPYAIRPGMPGDRPPPSEFDGLFRADGGPAEGADSTQQLPQFGDQGPLPGPPVAPDDGGSGRRGGGRRRMTPAALIGIVVGVCAIAGLAAGAALSAGGDDDKKDTKAEESQSPEPKGDDKTKAAVDPAEAQAKALDALLADSNNSRAAVIKAVEDIKSCKNLSTAATNLRTAAGQRTDLVTRLGKISVDKLPNHAQLTSSLTKAWRSSATADNQYAAWADQVGGKKGCHKGKARRTPRVGAAERASGEATTAKKKASELWNPIATKYGLTSHQQTEL